MNGGACCILELCCENSSAAADALAVELVKDGVVEAEAAARVAAWTFKHFDLAERGTLTAIKKSWAKHVRDHK